MMGDAGTKETLGKAYELFSIPAHLLGGPRFDVRLCDPPVRILGDEFLGNEPVQDREFRPRGLHLPPKRLETNATQVKPYRGVALREDDFGLWGNLLVVDGMELSECVLVLPILGPRFWLAGSLDLRRFGLQLKPLPQRMDLHWRLLGASLKKLHDDPLPTGFEGDG